MIPFVEKYKHYQTNLADSDAEYFRVCDKFMEELTKRGRHDLIERDFHLGQAFSEDRFDPFVSEEVLASWPAWNYADYNRSLGY